MRFRLACASNTHPTKRIATASTGAQQGTYPSFNMCVLYLTPIGKCVAMWFQVLHMYNSGPSHSLEKEQHKWGGSEVKLALRRSRAAIIGGRLGQPSRAAISGSHLGASISGQAISGSHLGASHLGASIAGSRLGAAISRKHLGQPSRAAISGSHLGSGISRQAWRGSHLSQPYRAAISNNHVGQPSRGASSGSHPGQKRQPQHNARGGGAGGGNGSAKERAGERKMEGGNGSGGG